MPYSPIQNINVSGSSAITKNSPWPISFLEAQSDEYVYSEWELEEIKKRAKAKFAEVALAEAANEKFIKDGHFVEDMVSKHHLPEIISDVKKKYQEASLQYDPKKVAVTKLLSGQKKSLTLTIDETKKYLEKKEDPIGGFMVPQIMGSNMLLDGTNDKVRTVDMLDNGLIVVNYDSKEKFDGDVAKARNQAINSERIGLNDKKCNTLVSIVKIKSYGQDPSYKIVSSDIKGVRVNNIDKKSYEELINHYVGGDDAKNKENREDLVKKIVHEVLPVRTSMSEEMKKFLLRQCENDYLFGIIPVPGRIGGRKDRLKAAMESANFSFSKENGVVVERDNLFPNRVTVTVNGESNQDTFIPLAHGCAVKVNKDGKIIPDTLFKLGEHGSVEEIDIKGGIFRLPLSMSGNLVNALKPNQAREKAKDVMEKYKKLELIVCKDEKKDKTNLGMSFMVLGKTHGLRLTDGEKIATTVSAGLLTVGLGFATGGAAAAGAVVGVGVAGSMTAVAGASTIKGAVNIIEDESVGRTIDSLIPTGGAQKAKSESFQNLTSNQR